MIGLPGGWLGSTSYDNTQPLQNRQTCCTVRSHDIMTQHSSNARWGRRSVLPLLRKYQNKQHWTVACTPPFRHAAVTCCAGCAWAVRNHTQYSTIAMINQGVAECDLVDQRAAALSAVG